MLQPIKLILADEYVVHRNGFAAMIKDFSEVELLATTDNGGDILQKAELHGTDMVILESKMPVVDTAEVCRLLQQQHPHIGIIVWTIHNETARVKEILQAGVRGFLMKSATMPEILHCIKKVHSGGTDYCREITAALSGLLCEEPGLRQQFTEVELAVLKLYCQEMTIKQIARELFYSVETIKLYMRRLREKCKVEKSRGLITYAISRGIVSV